MSLEPLDGPDPRSPQGGGVPGFVGGLVVGGLIGLWCWGRLDLGWWSALAPVTGAVLGARYGDRFWYWLVHFLRWS